MAAAYFTATPPQMEDGPGELVAMSIATGSEKLQVMMSINTFVSMYHAMRRDLDELLESTRAADVHLFEYDGGTVLRREGKKRLRLKSAGID